jgi:excisionase family DNA binding protein
MKENTKINLEEMITLPEAAKLIDLNPTYVRRLILAGRIVGFKFGRNYLVNRKSALSFKKTPGCGRPRAKSRPNR